MKVGAAFFGWLTAFGTATILTALLAATGAALGLGAEDVEAAADQVGLDAGTIGWIGAIALLVILFVAYYCGGYVAGRMARFNGVVQGLAVWVWALVIAIVVALLGVVVGSQYDVFADLNIFPRIPLSEGDLTMAGIATAVAVAVASLGGAVLGGKAGTHYHRKVGPRRIRRIAGRRMPRGRARGIRRAHSARPRSRGALRVDSRWRFPRRRVSDEENL